MQQFGDVQLTADGHVTVVEMQRPPHNFFDAALVGALADALEYLDGVDACRAVVLAAQGRSFSAGANFHVLSMNGAFHGVITTAGPAGIRCTTFLILLASQVGS